MNKNVSQIIKIMNYQLKALISKIKYKKIKSLPLIFLTNYK